MLMVRESVKWVLPTTLGALVAIKLVRLSMLIGNLECAVIRHQEAYFSRRQKHVEKPPIEARATCKRQATQAEPELLKALMLV
ncbi:MAG: hypothetical protein KIH01_03865 [Candidatus Freyarchaeota archaeon]|nr:hypothetical protein [Candidatus Jordarchaeia archaeon]